MVKLRHYQLEAVETIRKTFETDSRQYVCMPTGSGKTITFLYYAKKYHQSILVIVPSCQLLEQVYETALLFYHPSEISRKGNGYNQKISKIHIVIINSIRGDYLDVLVNHTFDLTVIDEAHHTQSKSYKRFIKMRSHIFLEKEMLILGMTATPDRSDGQLLEDILYKRSFSIDVLQLIKNKELSDIEGFSVKTKIDISEIDNHNGDFSLKQLYNKLCIDSRNNLIVDIYKKELTNRKTIIFCIDIAHSKKINQMLLSQGISSDHIDGTMNDTQRASILSAFRSGEVSVLCNCQLLTEGFDEPSIDGIILARPTSSRSLFTQMIGRGLRLFPGKKNCKVIDVVDNHKLQAVAGFTSILTDENDSNIDHIDSFKSIRDIESHLQKERLKITEFSIERSNLFSNSNIENEGLTESMRIYLNENKITYFPPISFDEGSFLIWMNELKKEYLNGKN